MHALSGAIQQTVHDFHSEYSEWEGEVLELFDDVDRFLAAERRADGGSATASVAEDVAGLKGLVEQQTEVLTALVNALTGQAGAVDPTADVERTTNHPSTPEIDPFERLQQAVAAAAETS